MPVFHDNKLKMVSLDDNGDDPTYLPPRKSAKASKAPHGPKPQPDSTQSITTSNMGNLLSCPVGQRKRKQAPVSIGHHYNNHQQYSNRPDSGIDGYPLEPVVGQSTNSGTITLPNMHPGTPLAAYMRGLMNTSQDSFYNDQANWVNDDTGVQYLGDQNRRHVGGYDVDLRIPDGYPSSPRINAFAAQENREGFAHLPGNPFESTDSLRPGDPNYGVGAINFSQNNASPSSQQPVVLRLELPDDYEASHFACFKVDRSDGVRVKEESYGDTPMKDISVFHGEPEESDEEVRTSKLPKINKDGNPRKPRQPRAKLLKWTDDDWKNVVLGIVWACGEVGLPIPFDQAAQVVATSCTASALQQALLKLRDRQIAEGHQIPLLKMAWTRKNKPSKSSPFNADANIEQTSKYGKTMLPKKMPTRQAGNHALIVTLKRAYLENDRAHLPKPYIFVVDSFHIEALEDNVDEDLGAQSTSSSTVPVPSGSGNNAGSASQAGAVGSAMPQTGLNQQAFALPRSGYVTPPRPIVATTPPAPRRVRQILHSNVQGIPFALAGATHATWMESQMAPASPSVYDPDFSIFGPELITPSNSSSPLAHVSSSASVYDTASNSIATQGGVNAQVDLSQFMDSIFNNSSVGPATSAYSFLDNDENLPRTPPRSAAAEDELARRMASSNREDGAFNPQGHTSYASFFEDELFRTDFWDLVENGDDNVFDSAN